MIAFRAKSPSARARTRVGTRARIGAVAALLLSGALGGMGWSTPGVAQETAPAKTEASKAKAAKSGTPFAGFGSNSKEPIKIDANRLEVFDKENRAVYAGDVVLVQGQTTLRSSTMTIFYVSAKAGSGAAAAPAAGQNSIRKIDFEGPVSILSGTQSATSKFMTYDAQAETVTLTGNVIISDCDNVQRGERAIYDVKTGRATVDAGAKGRVQGIFTPGSEDKKKTGGECGGKRS